MTPEPTTRHWEPCHGHPRLRRWWQFWKRGLFYCTRAHYVVRFGIQSYTVHNVAWPVLDDQVHCPDTGMCHHECGSSRCWRLDNAGPLSIACYPNNEWPEGM